MGTSKRQRRLHSQLPFPHEPHPWIAGSRALVRRRPSRPILLLHSHPSNRELSSCRHRINARAGSHILLWAGCFGRHPDGRAVCAPPKGVHQPCSSLCDMLLPLGDAVAPETCSATAPSSGEGLNCETHDRPSWLCLSRLRAPLAPFACLVPRSSIPPIFPHHQETLLFLADHLVPLCVFSLFARDGLPLSTCFAHQPHEPVCHDLDTNPEGLFLYLLGF
jgi:hypothetical protein